MDSRALWQKRRRVVRGQKNSPPLDKEIKRGVFPYAHGPPSRDIYPEVFWPDCEDLED